MRGVHDLGGIEGLGPVVVERDEPVFHHPWEADVFRLAMASFGLFKGGEFRHAIERMDPAAYLSTSYYEHWLSALETLMVEQGHLDDDELRARGGGTPHRVNAVHPESSAPPAVAAAPRFDSGDRVTVRRSTRHGHSRCPGYLDGVEGRVVKRVATWTLDDAAAHGAPRREQVYLVRFRSDDVWGPPCESHEILVELWETHLEHAEA